VRLAGRDVTALPPYRRPVHTVFQNYALFPHLSVAGNVGFPLRMAGLGRAEIGPRVERALSWVQLDGFGPRRVDQLSGGERQRVALARALADEPACVLLDEPLSALDPHLRGRTLEFLQATQARLGLSYLYVTHDREEALRAAHRLAVLHRGRLQQVGTPEALYRRPANAFVAGFVGPITWLPGSVSGDGVRLAAGATVPLPEGDPPSAREVVVGVRPEDVRIDDSGFLTAKVVARQFAGATVSLRLTVAGGPPLAVELRGGAVPAVGEEVRVSWPAAAAHVFAAEEDGM
jgi:ABC-type Fe3+/spermidine/putrescine transport system ATPase subunit